MFRTYGGSRLDICEAQKWEADDAKYECPTAMETQGCCTPHRGVCLRILFGLGAATILMHDLLASTRWNLSFHALPHRWNLVPTENHCCQDARVRPRQ
jgi:hypothetical protein